MNANTSISKTARLTTTRRLELDPAEDTVFTPELKALLEQGGENSKKSNPTDTSATPAGAELKPYNLD